MERPSPQEIQQIIGTVQSHHGRLKEIDKTLGSTPDPATLRHVEHVVAELPTTDEIKESLHVTRNLPPVALINASIKMQEERSKVFSRIVIGIAIIVGATIMVALSSLIAEGIKAVLATNIGKIQ